MKVEEVKKLNIPQVPGCYLFKDKTGKIIYVGKAVNLRSRVLSYWREKANHSPAKFSMMKRIEKIDWIEVETEVEALLLEANLIKKHQPQYNIDQKDDKRYTYIKISTEEKYPRIFATRKIDKAGRYFGPFVSAESVRETLKIIRKIWPFRSCVTMPKKVCLYYRIGKCQGMCEDFITETEYKKVIQQIILFLEGKKNKVIKNYELQITNLEKKKNGEVNETLQKEIDFLKYQLLNLKKVLSGSNVLSLENKYAADVVELAKILGLPHVPDRIEGYDISNIYGQAAVGSMVVFEKGEPNKNEYRKFKIKIEDSMGDTGMLKEVLERRLKHIKFTHSGLQPLLQGGDLKKWPTPDLIIIDGGKGQLNTVLRVLKQHELSIPVIAVSKGEGLRSAQAPDKIFFPGEKKPLLLPLSSPALHIIKRVRDEAHRFAIKYHKELRKRKMFK